MHFSTQAALLAVLPVALAQYGNGGGSATSSSGASAPSSSSTSNIQVVKVGNGGLNFSPNNFTAAVGSTIEFEFYAPSHSVAQSTFAAPCVGSGFYSGVVGPTTSGMNSQVFTITINDTKPIWFYCGYASHCEAGMVGVINGPTDGSKTLDQFTAAAKLVSKTQNPPAVAGGVLEQASAVSSGTSGSSGTSSTSSGSTPSPTKNAGLESNGGVKWTLMGLTGAVAVGLGSLIV